MQRKKKICQSCQKECYYFSRRMCKGCASKTFKKPKLSKKTIKHITERHKEQIRKYQKIRDLYFLDHPICEFPGCNSRKIDCHHKAGKIGENRYKFLMSVCRKHHQYIHNNVLESYEKGWLLSRISKTNI